MDDDDEAELASMEQGEHSRGGELQTSHIVAIGNHSLLFEEIKSERADGLLSAPGLKKEPQYPERDTSNTPNITGDGSDNNKTVAGSEQDAVDVLNLWNTTNTQSNMAAHQSQPEPPQRERSVQRSNTSPERELRWIILHRGTAAVQGAEPETIV
ncbi:unnamed protein product [Pleuronectes platessa]|uniref:Uncharacterized protein n=1 Tax=Pleuronectes platessa TaxID=8262 RepID=A0A9N7YQ95_PLEPL|nr:unnamed protein product [Pleuronectes platessa]